jgi:hypothetical protein
MLISEKVSLVIQNNIREYYKNKGYTIPKVRNPIIEIDVNDLSNGSNKVVDCKCDVCGKLKSIEYWQYVNSMKKYNYYSCSEKCSR